MRTFVAEQNFTPTASELPLFTAWPWVHVQPPDPTSAELLLAYVLSCDVEALSPAPAQHPALLAALMWGPQDNEGSGFGAAMKL